MKNGLCSLPLAALSALFLTACNQTSPSAPPSSAAAAGCRAEIEDYRAIMDNDRHMGHVNISVYNRVVKEIDQASAACATGRDAEALHMVSATRSRYGYR